MILLVVSELFPNDHEISGHYADEQYPSEGVFSKWLDAFVVLCTGTGTETAGKIRIKNGILPGYDSAVFGWQKCSTK